MLTWKRKSSPSAVRAHRGGSRTVATSKMKPFVIIVNGQKPLTIITKSSILDVVAVLDPSLHSECTAGLLQVHIHIQYIQNIQNIQNIHIENIDSTKLILPKVKN